MNKEKLKNEYPLFIRIEKYQYSWLRKNSFNRKISIAKLIREILTKWINQP